MWPFKKKKPSKQRIFGAAAYNRLVGDWIASGTSIDAEIRTSLPALRNRSRQLARDNDYVRNFLRTVQNNVVGKGIPMQAQVRMQRGKKGEPPALDTATNDMIEAAWARWCRKENCDVAGKQCFQEIERIGIKSIAESGEEIIRMIDQPMGDMKTPFALQVMESDLLDDSYNAIADNGNEIRMGVEFNQWKRPVAYHFRYQHPGDYPVQNSVTVGRRIRVPASEIIHPFIMERPEQSRGFPWTASAMLRLHNLQGFEEAEVIAARTSASMIGTIETPEGDASIADDVQSGQSVTDFEPGLIKKLFPGEKFEMHSPTRPGGQFDPFVRSMLRAVAAGMGISYESLSHDYSQSNYSSSRLALQDDRDNWAFLQQWYIANFHQLVFERWMDRAVLSGDLPLKNYFQNPEAYNQVKWLPRGWGYIDPVKEVAAYKDAVRSGFMTQSEVIAETGGDYDEVMVQRKAEVDKAKSMDLVFDSDPNVVDTKGIDQPSGQPAANDNVAPRHKK